MIETSFLKRRWRLLLNLFTIAALIVLAYLIRHQIIDTFTNLPKVKFWILLLIIPLEFVDYHAQAKMYQKLFGVVGEKLSYPSLFKLSLELNFVNHVFPSGGVSGISYFGFRLRSLGVPGTRATLIQTMKLVLYFLSFEPILLFGMFILAVKGHADGLVIAIGSALTALLVPGTALLIFVISSQARIDNFLTPITVFLNRMIQIVRPKRTETFNIANSREHFKEFHRNYMLLRASYEELKRPFWWAMVANIAELAVIYVVYIAFSAYVNVGAIILAYGVANFAGLVSVLPGGTGIYEALMTAVLVATGIPVRLSLPVTVMYRILNTLLQLPPGYILYHRSVRGTSREEISHG